MANLLRNALHALFLPLMLAASALLAAAPAHAKAPAQETQTIWRLLDYVAVDYRGAVAGGRVINDAEYREMIEFSDSVAQRLAALPANPQKSSLTAGAARLERAIADKAVPTEVARLARKLGADLLIAYPVPLAPSKAPNLARGAKLFAENCASCHGVKG